MVQHLTKKHGTSFCRQLSPDVQKNLNILKIYYQNLKRIFVLASSTIFSAFNVMSSFGFYQFEANTDRSLLANKCSIVKC